MLKVYRRFYCIDLISAYKLKEIGVGLFCRENDKSLPSMSWVQFHKGKQGNQDSSRNQKNIIQVYRPDRQQTPLSLVNHSY